MLTELFQRPFGVSNPFMWLTKAEVVGRIAAHGFDDLIRHTRSCTRVRDMTVIHPHCGQCSQCIDRRFAILAAGLESGDPEEAYKVELLTGEREAGPDREMALAYVRSATAIRRMSDAGFFEHYGEASRAVGFFAESSDVAAEHILDLHRRHATAVCSVFERAVSTHASALTEQSLSPSCLLLLVVSQTEFQAETVRLVSGPKRRGPGRRTADAEPGLPPALARREIRMAIDPDVKRVVVGQWGEIKGVAAELLISLAEPHQQAMQQGLMPERYPYTQTGCLLKRLRIASAETLRRRVLRCRNSIEHLASKACSAPPPINAVIENQQWHGYRLNPDTVRMVALTELTGRK